MDIRQLKVLRTMLRAGSVSETARLLYISQPAVSKTLSSIEESFGVTLFQRVNGRLIATAEADSLCPEIDRLLNDHVNLLKVARELRDGKIGKIRVAASPTAISNILPKAIVKFKETRPQVEFTLLAGSSSEITDRVGSNHVDFGLAQIPNRDVRVVATKLYTNKIVCVLPATHSLCALSSLGPIDLANQKLIAAPLNEPDGSSIAEVFQSCNISFQPAMETNLNVASCALVKAGLGIALIGSGLNMDELFPELVIRPFVPEVAIPIYALRSSHHELTSLSQEFFELVHAQILALPSGPR